MSVESTDILVKFSTSTGPGDSVASTANVSLGGFISTTQVTDATLHNLFDVVSGAENAALEDEYRCIFIHNANATDTFLSARVFIASEVAGGANITIGVDGTAASAVGSAAQQAVEVADEDTAPTGVAFSAPTEYATGIDVNDLAAGECRAIWLKRTATDSAAVSEDGVTLRIQGESV